MGTHMLLDVDVGATLDQHAGSFEVPFPACQMQWRVAATLFLTQTDVCERGRSSGATHEAPYMFLNVDATVAVAHDELDHVGLVEPRRQMKRGVAALRAWHRAMSNTAARTQRGRPLDVHPFARRRRRQLR